MVVKIGVFVQVGAGAPSRIGEIELEKTQPLSDAVRDVAKVLREAADVMEAEIEGLPG